MVYIPLASLDFVTNNFDSFASDKIALTPNLSWDVGFAIGELESEFRSQWDDSVSWSVASDDRSLCLQSSWLRCLLKLHASCSEVFVKLFWCPLARKLSAELAAAAAATAAAAAAAALSRSRLSTKKCELCEFVNNPAAEEANEFGGSAPELLRSASCDERLKFGGELAAEVARKKLG